MVKWIKKFLKIVTKSGESSKNQQLYNRKCDICHKEFSHFTTHTCKHCSRIFCNVHKKPNRHNCKILQNKKLKKIKLENVMKVRGVDDNIIRKIDEKQEPKIKTEFKGCCEFCKTEVPYELDRFYCPYCNKWHCPKHRLPEEHNCSGKPKPPPGAFRELHTRNGITVIGK